MSIEEDREQRDRTFRAVTLTALACLTVWLLTMATLYIIGA